MAHELDFSHGVAAMLSVRETPWHREGVVLPSAPSLEEALAIAHLDFEVVKVPVSYRFGEAERPSDYAFLTLRTDTGAELGAVGPDYKPLQNRAAFRALEPLLDAGVATIETAGALRGGQDVWLLVRFDLARFGPIVREVFADEVVPYGLIRNNHAGKRKARVQQTPIRVVCANTLGGADARAESGKDAGLEVAHVGDVEAKVVEAAEKLFGALIERYEVLAKQYRLLKATVLSELAFEKVVLDLVAPDPRQSPRFNPEAKLAKLVVERAERKRAEVRRLWTAGAGHVGDNSAWEAYNGAVEAIDHNADLWPLRGGTFRTASLLDGVLADTKRDLVQRLVHVGREAHPELADVN